MHKLTGYESDVSHVIQGKVNASETLQNSTACSHDGGDDTFGKSFAFYEPLDRKTDGPFVKRGAAQTTTNKTTKGRTFGVL